jgi:hypothetical protein
MVGVGVEIALVDKGGMTFFCTWILRVGSGLNLSLATSLVIVLPKQKKRRGGEIKCQ